MVIYEEISGTDLVRAYSNNNMLIRQDETGYLYSEAIDPNYIGRTYTETDIPIEEDFDINENNEEAIKNLLATGLINIPTEEDTDYFNENEEEVNYFE